MDTAFTVLLLTIATLSIPWTVRRYRSATLEQRQQIVWAYGAAMGGGVLIGILIAMR